MLKRIELMQTNRPIDVVCHWRENGFLLLDPPYQRGDVWGPIRRRNFIKSLIQGVPIPSIIINDRCGADWGENGEYAVIDGKQRLTTVLMFLDNQLGVPGEWFDMRPTFREVLFGNLNAVQQRKLKNRPMAFSEARLATLKAEQEVFELVNYGGVPQGEADV